MAKPVFEASFVSAQNTLWSQKSAKIMIQILFLHEVFNRNLCISLTLRNISTRPAMLILCIQLIWNIWREEWH